MPRPYEVEIEKNAKTDRRARATMEPQKQSEREKQEPAPSPNKKAVQPPQAETEREGEITMCNTWALSIHSNWYLLCVSLLCLFICPSVLLFNRWSFVLAMMSWFVPFRTTGLLLYTRTGRRGAGSASTMCKSGGQCLRASVDSSQCSHLTDS